MSTRAVITVIDNYGEYHLYRHSDGYPETKHGVLATLSQAFPFAWELPRFEADDFAAALVRAWKKEGGDIRLTNHYDNHGDLAYRYEVSLMNHTNKLIVKTFVKNDGWKEVSQTLI